jgi:hypothetical protein
VAAVGQTLLPPEQLEHSLQGQQQQQQQQQRRQPFVVGQQVLAVAVVMRGWCLARSCKVLSLLVAMPQMELRLLVMPSAAAASQAPAGSWEVDGQQPNVAVLRVLEQQQQQQLGCLMKRNVIMLQAVAARLLWGTMMSGTFMMDLTDRSVCLWQLAQS